MASCASPDPVADLVLIDAKIVTIDSDRPVVEALAVRGDRIAAVGSRSEILNLAGPGTTVLDLRGRLATPGLIEGHAHFYGLGQARLGLDLTSAASWEEIVDLVAEEASRRPSGEWIVGRGWHQEKWTATPEPNVEGLPVHDALDGVSPAHPVFLIHASGHAAFANRRAMELAGVTAETGAPDGGEILRDDAGQPTGVFRETAQGLIRRAYNRFLESRGGDEIEAELNRVIELAAEACLENGVTSFQDAGASFEMVEAYRRAAEAGRLPVRLWVMLNEPNDRLEAGMAEARLVGHAGHLLTVRAVKRLMDGALGAHGAWLFEPYADLPSSRGLQTESLEDLEVAAELAARHDFQLCVHAIGDRANHEVLNLFERVFRRQPEGRDRRWRIEHAQHVIPDDVPRFAALGVVASVQPVHATSDGPWVIRRLGATRARDGAYVWRSLLDAGAVLCAGTDAPVEAIDPVACFYAAVSRRMADGEAFFPDQSMTREEALRAYTLDAAYAAFEEDVKGSLVPGKLADITVFSRDLLTVPEEEIPETRVVYTILGGRVVYDGSAGD
jgi:predicted amidohydrolase YtcJ